MALATAEADARPGERVLVSWYDRDLESTQHASECHTNAAVPGCMDYGSHHGATLWMDADDGRFVVFYLPVAL